MGVGGRGRVRGPCQSRHTGRVTRGAPPSSTYRANPPRGALAAANRYSAGRGTSSHYHIHMGGDEGRLAEVPRAGSRVPARPSRNLCCLPNMDGGASRGPEGSKELVEVGGGQTGGTPIHRRLDRRSSRDPPVKAQEEEAVRKYAEEEKARRRAETRTELERVRAQRLADERALLETRARLEAARRLEERFAGTLGEVDGPAASTPGWEPQTPPRLRYCPICGRPDVREVRRCPDRQHHPPKPHKR